ncbi:UNVERIFIED_CONTAM: hypothetical protein FKN15_062280 [Acipenser sinensis]
MSVFAATSSLSSDREVSGWEGGSVSVPCHYDLKYRDHVKYWCRGKSWELCEAVKRTDDPKRDEDKVSISDDQTRGVFIVTMRRLEKTDKGWYWYASSLSTGSAFTGLVGGSVSVPCHYDVKYRDHVKYWCKGYQWTYCDILKQTDSPYRDSDKISISDDRTGGVFIVTMRRLDKQDTAWYWCAIKLGGTKEADQHFYLYLTVTEGTPGLSVTSNLITGSEGGSASVSCQYAQLYTEHVKYWCRGREWASCETLVRTDTPQTGGEKVSISDDKVKFPRFFTVTVRRLEKKDAGWYWCAIQKVGADERIPLYLTVTDDASSLSTGSAFTGLVGGSVSVPCHYDVKYRDHVKYWCKGYQWTYCDILKQTDSPYRDSDKISISDDRTGGVFIVTMRRLDKQDTAWYWCAIKLGGTKEADQHFYLYLTVTEGTPGLSVTSNLITGSEGGSASVSCQYAQLYTEHVKYWCRGREWASCETLVRTDTPQTGGEKVSISDDKVKFPRFFTVTVRRLEKKDAGWYWCAIQKVGADERIPLYLTVTDGKVRKVSQQEDVDQRVDSPAPSQIPGEATTYATLEFQKRDSPTGDMGTVCNAQPSDAASALYAAVVKRPNRP